MNPIKILCLSAATILSAATSAHVPFLKPNQFNVHHNRLQIESSFTEFPFQADFAMTSPRFLLINAKGQETVLSPEVKTLAAIYLEPKLMNDGTYRIHADTRKGPKYNAIETEDGKLYFADDIKTKTGKKTFLQYYSCADTYITKGVSDYTPKRLNTGVEIIPLTAPNNLVSNQPITFQVFQDGQPVANARIVVVYNNEHYEKHRIEDLYDVENVRSSNLHADKNGTFVFSPKRAGLVLLFVTIHKKINPSLWESYNTSLTLEVQLPH